MPTKPILLAVTSDQHCNSTLGLIPAEGVKLPEGGRYEPSDPQRWLWANWLDYWSWIDGLCKQEKATLYCAFNGDAVDGTTHHEQVQFVTADEEAMMWLTEQVFLVPRTLMRKRKGKAWFLRGTRSHVGSAEQALARWFGAEREPDTDQWARYVLKLDLYGTRIDLRHHAQSVGGLPWTRTAVRLAALVFMEHVEAGHEYPHLAIRSHRHLHADSYDAHPTRAIVTPAWQLATDFVHKVVPEAIADIGGIAVLCYPDGEYRIEKRRYRPDPAPTYQEAS